MRCRLACFYLPVAPICLLRRWCRWKRTQAKPKQKIFRICKCFRSRPIVSAIRDVQNRECILWKLKIKAPAFTIGTMQPGNLCIFARHRIASTTVIPVMRLLPEAAGFRRRCRVLKTDGNMNHRPQARPVIHISVSF